MLRYQVGDVAAFETLLSRHEGPVYGFLLRSTRDRTKAEDLVQEVFLRVIKGAAVYKRTAKFTTWLYTIARNLCVDTARRKKHRNHASLDAPLRAQETQGATVGDQVAGSDLPADRQAIAGELGARIEAALSRLSPEQREVFLLREVGDLPFKEIAAIVECSENTVKSRMRYALEKLRDELAEYEDLARAAP